MRRISLLLLLAQFATASVWAQAPQPVVDPAAPSPAMEEKLPVEEPAPGFQPVRPVADDAAPAQPEPAVPQAPSVPAPIVESSPAPIPAPVEPSAASEAMTASAAGFPAWAVSVVLLSGAFLAGLFGVMTAMILRKGELAQRRRSVAATLATELETRLQAFEAVPLPPNAEAGVFFVSAVTALAGVDAGFRAAQTDLHLLPGKLASHISVHYAAVQRVADFVKGQSLAAAVRMLQANRMGGYPCPDAGTMREAHVEMTAAFRGLDKLILGLRAAE